MRRSKLLLSAAMVVAMALGLLGGAAPAGAASGYHAAYFSESSFLSLAAGQSGQFAVGYGNTGDQPWVKGNAQQQANLQTRNGSTTLFNAGWASNWVAPNVYANQTNDLVAPGQVGFFVYNITVPANAAVGPQQFTGIETLAGVPMEDYGYYQVVTVSASTLRITGSSPASPSTTTTPVISGTGASAAVTITVQEGSTSLCTATADSSGNWSCTTSALSSGSHAITATGPNQGTTAVFTYVVDNSAPAISTIDTAQGLKRMNVCYNKAMATAGTGSITSIVNYSLSGFTLGTTTGTGQVINSIIASSDSRCALFVFDTGTLVNGSSYTLTVSNVKDSSGNLIAAGSTFSFSAQDSLYPTASSISQPGNQEIVITFNKAMDPTTLTAANLRWDSAAFPGSIAIRANGTGLNRQVRLTFTVAASVGTHTLDIANVRDASANLLSPNPTSYSVSIVSDTNRPSVSGATAARGDFNLASTGGGAAYLQTIAVTFSEGMKRAADWGLTNALDNSANYTLTNPDGSNATTGCANSNGTALNIVASGVAPAGMLTDDTDERFELRQVRLTVSALMATSCNYSLTIQNVQDQAGNALSPNPTLVSVTSTADTTTLTVASASVSATTLTVCYSKSMFASMTLSTGGYTSNTTGSNTANYSLSAPGGALVTLTWGGNAGNNWNVTPDGKCVSFATPGGLASGTYSLSVTNVTDPAGNLISPNPSTVTVTYSDTSVPTLTAATYISRDSMSVTYSKAMAGGSGPTTSAGNVVNYSLNNNSFGDLCAVGAAQITSFTSGTVWRIECTGTGAYLKNVNYASPALANTGAYLVTVRNVTDTNGNVLSPNPSSRSY